MNEIIGIVSLVVMIGAFAAMVLVVVRWFQVEREFRCRTKEVEDDRTK